MLQLTLVVDAVTGETIEIVAALFDTLRRLSASVPIERSQRIDWEPDLRAASYPSGRDQFQEQIEKLSTQYFPPWSADDLACHPHEAQQFRAIVRRVVAPVPDHLVMKALMHRRKHAKNGATGSEPRPLWRR